VEQSALCVANHLLRRHRDPAALPEDTVETMLTYQRYRTISQRSAGTGLSTARMREALDAARADGATDTPDPVRTLWRSVFDLERRTMTAHLYLGDAPGHSPELESTILPSNAPDARSSVLTECGTFPAEREIHPLEMRDTPALRESVFRRASPANSHGESRKPAG
jgi:hypothetical protein